MNDDEELLALLIAEVDEEEKAVPDAPPASQLPSELPQDNTSSKIKRKLNPTTKKGPSCKPEQKLKLRYPHSKRTKLQQRDDFLDNHSQLRIKNRIVGTVDMDEHMKDRTTYLLPKLATVPQWKLEDNSKDWVTFGVLISKSASKSASNGGTYAIWKLSDLVRRHDLVQQF